jgi:serine/threonine protein kinase
VAKVLTGLSNEPEPPRLPRDGIHAEVLSQLHTAAGTVLGTPAYMAPEQAMGETSSVDQRTDVYALGALLYFLLTRRPPGEPTSHQPHPRALNPTVPRAVDAVCSKAMSARPNDRYAGVESLSGDIARYLDGSKVSAYRENVLEAAVRWIGKNRFVTLLVLAYLIMRVIIFFVTGR